MEYSKYQLDIFDAYERTDKNIVISARAGSGKTSTLLELLKRKKPHHNAIFLAFNKSIAEELKRRVPYGVDVSTIHSYGAKMLFRYWDGNVEIKPNKVFSFGIKFLKQWGLDNNEKKFEYLGTVTQLVDFWRLYLCKNQSELTDIADYRGVTCLNGEIDHSLELIEALERQFKYSDEKKQIDFTDMIYLPATLEGMQFKQYDEVFLDESQDFSKAQQIIVNNIIKPRGRFISCGDPFQGIYIFIGSDSSAFENFKNKPNTVSLPLSISYRCPKKVVEKANTVFNITEPFEKAKDGEVREGSINEVESGDFVLCRNNQPLIEAYLNFLIQGKKAHIKGRDLGNSILKLVSKIEDMSLSKGKKFLRELLSEVIEDLKNSQVQKSYKHPRYIALKEKVDIIGILIDKYGTFKKLQEALKEMFVDNPKNGIILSTIHRSKGLETDNVFILRRELIPSQYAEKSWELEQEQNLLYVAYTRSKDKLIFITDF